MKTYNLGDNTPVDTAFNSSVLMMPTSVEINGYRKDSIWENNRLNSILVFVAILLVILLLRRLLNIVPKLLSGLLRLKEYEKLEESMSLVRERNSLLLLAVLILGLVSSKYILYAPSFLQNIDEGIYSIVIISIIIALILLRQALFFVLSFFQVLVSSPVRLFYNFIILYAILGLIVSILSIFFDLSLHTTILLMYAVFSVLYLLYIIRRIQILSNYYSLFTLILYLCTLEILPVALLVVSDIFL